MNTDQIFLKELLIIIVIFEKSPLDASAFQSLDSIRKEAMVVFYDNSSLPHQISKIQNAIYFHDPSNPGVSKAYNFGSALARAENKNWLLLTDQDTVFPNLFFEKYQHAIGRHRDSKIFAPRLLDHIGLVSPFSFALGKGKRIASSIETGVHDLSKFRLANSGLLISLEAFEAVGGYDERFPLDYSDIVFIDKFVNQYAEFVLVDIQCTHSFSGSEKKSDPSLIKRFNGFCQAARLYKKITPKKVTLYWVLLPRAIKLFLQSGNFHFVKIAWNALMTS